MGLGLFMDLVDATIVNVTLPTLGRDFGASTDTLEWLVTGVLRIKRRREPSLP